MGTHDSIRDALRRGLSGNRVHGAYLLSGAGAQPRETALWWARMLACADPGEVPCEECAACRRSAGREEIPLDGAGKKGPLLRHIGDHADLFWVERGEADTRVRIGQVRALQSALRLRSSEGGRRVAVIADAEWLNLEAQNALLRLLEEPPPLTTLVLVSSSAAGLLATVRSRCQRYAFPPDAAPDPRGPDAPEEIASLVARLDALRAMGLPEILDWAEEFRGGRAEAAEAVSELLSVSSAWLRDDVRARVDQGAALPGLDARLRAFQRLMGCRKALVQRNANPQMVAERALIALREALAQ